MLSDCDHMLKSNMTRHKTETTTSAISEGTPDRSTIVSGRSLTGIRSKRPTISTSVSSYDENRNE